MHADVPFRCPCHIFFPKVCNGKGELSDADLLGKLCAEELPDVPLDLTLVRRSLEQVEWLRLAEEEMGDEKIRKKGGPVPRAGEGRGIFVVVSPRTGASC